MILEQKMLQEIADKIISDIGYNINIIDVDGIIVASGSKERIGTYHQLAHQAAQQDSRVDISKQDEANSKGVKVGINQPFYYKNELVGVIGITGNTKSISDFVNIVKAMIEIMVEQELLKSNMFLRETNKTHFANLLINAKTDSDLNTLKNWGNKLSYDFTLPRVLLLVDLPNEYNVRSQKELLRHIKKVEDHRRNDFTAFVKSNQILIVKSFKKFRVNLATNNEINSYAQNVFNAIKNKVNITPFIGVSTSYENIIDYSKAYDEANFVINQLKMEKHSIFVASINDYLFPYLASNLPKGFLDHYISDIYEKINNKDILIESLVAMAKNNMNLVESSKYLCIHRNTLIARLDKIKELTNLDIRSDGNARLICYLMEAHQ